MYNTTRRIFVFILSNRSCMFRLAAIIWDLKFFYEKILKTIKTVMLKIKAECKL
jgi:hypothetical protein